MVLLFGSVLWQDTSEPQVSTRNDLNNASCLGDVTEIILKTVSNTIQTISPGFWNTFQTG